MDCKGLKRGLNFLPVASWADQWPGYNDDDHWWPWWPFLFLGRGAGDDHGPPVRRSLLRRHRYRSRAQVPEGQLVFAFWWKYSKYSKIFFRAPEEWLSQTSRATSPRYLRALSNFSMARLTKELRWAGWKWLNLKNIFFFEHFLFFVLYPLLQQFSSKVKPYVLDDQLCDECQGGRYSDE